MKVTEVIEAIDDGMAVQAIDEKLREIVDAVMLHQKQGEMTMSISVMPAGQRRVNVHVQVKKSKVPEAPLNASTFFTDEGGKLHRSDPKQLTIKDLTDKVRPIKDTEKKKGD